MTGDYYCAYCEARVAPTGEDSELRCPACGQKESVKPLDDFALVSDIRRQWYVVFALLFAAGIAVDAYEWFGTGP